MRNATQAAIVSRNQGSGFFGAVRAHAGPEEAWALAVRSIANSTGCSDEAVRVFLDGRYGRHFADDVLSDLLNDQELASAIDRAVERWMGRRIDRQIDEEIGIPQGLPYLTGFVCMHEALLKLST